MNDSRRSPWLSGLLAAILVAVWLIAVVATGIIKVMNAIAASG